MKPVFLVTRSMIIMYLFLVFAESAVVFTVRAASGDPYHFPLTEFPLNRNIIVRPWRLILLWLETEVVQWARKLPDFEDFLRLMGFQDEVTLNSHWIISNHDPL